MRNLKIGTRLGLGFGLIVVLLLITSSIGIWRLMATQQASQFLQSRQSAQNLMLQWARVVEVNTNQTLAAASVSEPQALKTFQAGMARSDEQAETLRNALQNALTEPEAASLLEQITQIQQNYLTRRNAAFRALRNDDIDSADAFFSHEMPRIATNYIGKIDELIAFQTNYVKDLFDTSNARDQLGVLVLSIATLLALILGPLFAWGVTRSVTRPLSSAVELAESVARRDLTHHVPVVGRDEIARLLQALDTMMMNLRSVVSEVHAGAESIATAATQITTGNLDLSSRTEQQASSLAETAATMEEITATVRQNADSAQQANTLAGGAAKTAQEGGGVVGELVQTMGEINTKSQQVADIIGVIDSIAFQTNILALNAAVEAARAGEQGRGFAVVASEVRALAQRSASAAKEIKALIDSSVEATGKGNEQAARAGTTMEEIVEGIKRVTDIVAEISAANREQTTGIEEINTAITQMDDVTRQNANLVEASAGAAGGLKTQADTLATLVATFRLRAADEAAGGNGPRAQTQATGGSAPAGAAFARADAALPAAPEKVVSPPPSRPRREVPAPATSAARPTQAAPATPGARPALRAPGRPTPDENEEWTEF